jgi:lysophospholipase L1-like esterase
VAGSSRGSDTEAPGGYYLSLGDSLATGVQPTGREERQFRTDEGYSDQLVSIARSRLPGLRAVKLGYPGESTITMIEGGLTSYASGSQLREATSFLRRHRGDVAFVTLDVGFNDFPDYSIEAVPIGLASIGRNLPGILDALREAAGPSVPIAGMTIYDAFLVRWLEGIEGQGVARASVWDAFVPINARLSEIYHAAGLRVADVEGAFATTDFDTYVELEGFGPVPMNVARASLWTWAAAPPPLGPDLHANAQGYRVIAEAFARVLLPDVPRTSSPGPDVGPRRGA